MFPKAHLTSHSRISGSRLVITPHDYLGHEYLFRTVFLCICHLFLISSASVRFILLLSFFVSISVWNLSLVCLIFFKWSLDFPILLLSCISLHWSLRKDFLSHLAILWTLHSNRYFFPFLLCLSLLFFSQLFVRPSQTTFLHFIFLGMVLINASCTVSQTSIHRSSGTLSIRSNPLNLSLPLYNCKWFDLGHTWMV